jgi:hypothetical protein
MSASIREIVTAAQEIVGEVAGAGVQTYGEDRMMKDTISVFNMLHKKYFWPQFIEWFELTLNGTTGRVTDADAFNYVYGFEDIFAIYVQNTGRRLLPIPHRINPYTLTGDAARYYGSIPANDADYIGRRIKIYPVTATGIIQVGAKVYPLTRVDADPESEWDWDDIMELDADMLIHGTAWRTLNNDGMNPQAAAAEQALMEARYNDITKRFADQEIEVSDNRGVPMSWYTNPY